MPIFERVRSEPLTWQKDNIQHKPGQGMRVDVSASLIDEVGVREEEEKRGGVERYSCQSDHSFFVPGFIASVCSLT